MLIFADARLTYLATPKTGSTAIETALRPMADIVFARQRKHITAQRYHKKVAPFLAETFGIGTETVALMREPVEQLRSWYRYRAREAVAGQPRSTEAMSFDAFAEAAADPAPPEFADVGSQFAFLTGRTGEVQVDHLFAYENMDGFLRFVSTRLDTAITLERRNVSPQVEAPLSERVRAVIETARAQDFALYQRLCDAGGYLGPA